MIIKNSHAELKLQTDLLKCQKHMTACHRYWQFRKLVSLDKVSKNYGLAVNILKKYLTVSILLACFLLILVTLDSTTPAT